MARLAYYIHGRGRGHAARALPILKALRAGGHDVRTYGGGAVNDVLGGDPEHEDVPPVLPGLGAVIATPRRIAAELRRLRGRRPDLVISDGDMPSLLAAKTLGLPTLAVGHDLVFNRCQLPAGLPKSALRYEALSALAAGRADWGVAVHFLPIAPKDARTRVARPALREELRGPTSSEGHYVAYFRDQNGASVLSQAVRLGAQVVSFGDDGPAVAGVQAHRFDRERFSQALRSCRGVIASAGSNVLGECVQLGKPLLALYRRGDHEQHLNAILATAAGVALGTELESVGERVVAEFLGRAQRGDFARVDLAAALPETVEAVCATVEEALN